MAREPQAVYNLEQRKQLGMPVGTARNKLLRKIIFNLCEQLQKNFCYVCKNPFSENTWSIEHITPWQKNGVDFYWNLNNISFSHKKCNRPKEAPGKKVSDNPDYVWCSGHQSFLPFTYFYKSSTRWTGFRDRCMSCDSRKTTGRRIPVKGVYNHQKIKEQILGMSPNKARAILIRKIVFKLLCELGKSNCYKCSKEMAEETWSIEHVKPWLHEDVSLFWDINNISFSHKACNRPDRGKKIKNG